MWNLSESGGSHALLFLCLMQRELASLLLHTHAERFAFEGDARVHSMTDLLLVIGIDRQRFFGDANRTLGKREFIKALRRSSDGILALGVKRVIGGFDELLRRQ